MEENNSTITSHSVGNSDASNRLGKKVSDKGTRSELSKLRIENVKIQKEFNDLQENYNKLFSDYTLLKVNHSKLQRDYRENTIVQSMNDMKEQYDYLKKNTVTLSTFNNLQMKYNQNLKICVTSSVLSEHIYNQFKRIHETAIGDDRNLITRLQMEILILRDICQTMSD